MLELGKTEVKSFTESPQGRFHCFGVLQPPLISIIEDVSVVSSRESQSHGERSPYGTSPWGASGRCAIVALRYFIEGESGT
jgi:hypothetical protein